MLVLKSDIPANNANLPRWSLTDEEMAILRLNPTAWVESDSGVVLNNGNVTAVRDKTGKATWYPAGSRSPTIKLFNEKPAFYFGNGVANSGALLAGNGYQSIPANGIYSLFLLYRIPVPNTEGRAGTGGNIAGNNEAPGEWLRFRFGIDTYLNDTIFLNHGGKPVSGAPENYPINSHKAGWRDSQFHISLIQAGADFHSWEIDSVLLQETPWPARPFQTDASRQLIIGGAANPLEIGFQGEIAAFLMLPGELRDGAKALIYDRFTAMKEVRT